MTSMTGRAGNRLDRLRRVPLRVRWAVAALIAAAAAGGIWTQRNVGLHSSSSPAITGTVTQSVRDVQQPIHTAEERVATVEHSLRALEDAVREAPRDRWDPTYVVSEVGSDPRVLFEWVRNNTAWIPYRGVLRGAIGVLMDRQGNSLDRAILLATLLESGGHKVRLAYCQLTDTDALTRATAVPDMPRRGVEATEAQHVSVESIRATAERYQLDPNTITQTIDAHNQAAIRIARDLDARVSNQTMRLLRDVVRTDPRTDWVKRHQDAVSARREHWWVQLDSAGTWSDFDVDEAGATAQSGLIPERTLLLEDLASAGLHHQIVFRVIAEQWSRGTVTERTAMEHTLRPAELIGQPIVVQFLAESALTESLGPIESAVETAIGEQRGWMVSLIVGSDLVASGLVERRVTGGGPFGGLGSAIASMGGVEDRELSAVWLEYEIRVPDESPQVIRRTVFDLIGPAARFGSSPPSLTLDDAKQLERSLALTMRTELLTVACRLSRHFVSHLLAENLIRNRNLLRVAAQNFGSPPAEAMDETLEAAVPPVSALYTLALARLDWSGDADHVYVDRAGLLTAHTNFVRKGNETLVRSATDIVANPIGVSLAVRDAFPLRLTHGVLDTNAEAYLHAGVTRFDNAADAFALPHSWVTLGPSDDPAVAQLQLSDDVRRRIRDDLAAGYVVVAPRSPVPTDPQPFSGWWRIDPASGHTLGVGANGWGTVAGEDLATQRPGFWAAPALRKAGIRAFWVFNVTTGFCLLPYTVTNVEQQGLRLGLKAVVVENSNQCAYEGLFWAALATVPLVLISARIRLSAMASAEVGVAGEAGLGAVGAEAEAAAAGAEGEAAAAEGPPGGSASPKPESVAPQSPQGQSPRGTSVPPPAPRGLPEIEADIRAAERDAKAAADRFEPMAEDAIKQAGDARRRGVSAPLASDEFVEALVEKSTAESRVQGLKNEYLERGGRFDSSGQPAGGYDPGLPRAPPPGAGTTQDLGTTSPDLGDTMPGGRPGPIYAPVRGGPQKVGPAEMTIVGLGGLAGVK